MLIHTEITRKIALLVPDRKLTWTSNVSET